jgi:hypothetical protein
MVQEEKEKRVTKKWKATYLGNSVRSKRRWKLEGKKTEAAGYPSVKNFFLKWTHARQETKKSGSSLEVSILTV